MEDKGPTGVVSGQSRFNAFKWDRAPPDHAGHGELTDAEAGAVVRQVEAGGGNGDG